MLHLKQEKTFVMVKPDGVKRGLVGEIISRFEKRGLKIIALEMFKPTRNQIDEHYPKDESWIARLGEKTMTNYNKYGVDPLKELGTANTLEIGKLGRDWLLSYMTCAPSVKMIVQGVHAVDMVRKIVGHSLPNQAEMGTIRGDFSVDSPAVANTEKRAVHNLVHASETSAEAEHEILFWFAPEEIHEYKRAEEEMQI